MLSCVALIGGCKAPVLTVTSAAIAADAALITAIHRDAVDVIVSGITGQDCSIVRLDRGKSYCRPIDPPPVPPAYCTATLGLPECWASPMMFANPPRGLADGPWALTPAQEATRVRPFPPL